MGKMLTLIGGMTHQTLAPAEFYPERGPHNDLTGEARMRAAGTLCSVVAIGPGDRRLVVSRQGDYAWIANQQMTTARRERK